ncbi:TrfA protein [Methylovulum psychrotolerans]|uniref:plasmid replication initiator TrfA n=1 Tax=Methylovulum psychrotolerans TaxID=1704499 RepID=UPI001BFFA464|nr:plasmid replication initiator TrfA [Methylovulum psychrotolerans]MBT9100579.1 TrfA protein [Methylovulum psychrotolerans]
MTDPSKDTGIHASIERIKDITQKREITKIIQLPLWPESKRGTPNSFLRSALFSAIQGKDRQYLREATLFSQQGIIVKFTGLQLNQEDLTLWETLVHLAKEHPLGNTCNFTAYEILKSLGLPTGGKNHKDLHSSVIRLTACAVEISHEGKTYFGSLIESGAKDELTSHYNIKLNRQLIRLYSESTWTAINWDQRTQIRKKPLAQALHGYYSSHKTPYPLKLTTLQRITGSRNKQPASFKRQCHIALDELVKIGFLQSYEIEGDTVSVKRSSTLIQE